MAEGDKGHFEHERERMHRIVDGFIDAVEEQWGPEDQPRLDSPVFIGMVEYRDPDADEDDPDASTIAVPFWFSETKRKHFVMATLDACSLVIQGRYLQAGMMEDGDEEEDTPDDE